MNGNDRRLDRTEDKRQASPTLRTNSEAWAKQAPKRDCLRLVSEADIARMTKLLGNAEGL